MSREDTQAGTKTQAPNERKSDEEIQRAENHVVEEQESLANGTNEQGNRPPFVFEREPVFR